MHCRSSRRPNLLTNPSNCSHPTLFHPAVPSLEHEGPYDVFAGAILDVMAVQAVVVHGLARAGIRACGARRVRGRASVGRQTSARMRCSGRPSMLWLAPRGSTRGLAGFFSHPIPILASLAHVLSLDDHISDALPARTWNGLPLPFSDDANASVCVQYLG